MSNREPRAAEDGHVSLGRRRIFGKPLTAGRAARLIGEFTLLVTVLGGTFAWLIDREDFPSLGVGLWWAVQTVTTVGYGDVTPTHAEGRLIATVVMLVGIGSLAVITATITAAFIQGSRQKSSSSDEGTIVDRLDRIDERLARLERAIEGPDRPN